MLKIHTADGETIPLDLSDENQAREWLPRLQQDRFQSTISGVSVVEHHTVRVRCPGCGERASGQIGVQYSVSRPEGLNLVCYELERIQGNGRKCDKVTVFAGDVCLILVAHESQPSARISLVKSGKRRFVPRRKTR